MLVNHHLQHDRGYYPPTEGKIFYNGEDITNKKAYEYTNMKIARTFQIMKPLKNLSVSG